MCVCVLQEKICNLTVELINELLYSDGDVVVVSDNEASGGGVQELSDRPVLVEQEVDEQAVAEPVLKELTSEEAAVIDRNNLRRVRLEVCHCLI